MDYLERFDSLEKGDVLGWRDLHADLVKRDTTRNSFLRRRAAKHGGIVEPNYLWVILPTVIAGTVMAVGISVGLVKVNA